MSADRVEPPHETFEGNDNETVLPPTLDTGVEPTTAEAGITETRVDEIFENARYALDLTPEDAVARADDIHNTFIQLLRAGGPLLTDENDESDEAQSSGADVKSSEGEVPPEEEDNEEEEEKKENYADDDDDDSIGEGDPEFAEWMQPPRQRRPTLQSQTSLGYIDMSEERPDVLSSDKPERLVTAITSHSSLFLQRASTTVVPDEGVWILTELFQPGQALSRSTTAAAAVQGRTLEQLRESPLVQCIERALFLMWKQNREPAHIAVYYREEFQPLLNAIQDGSVESGTTSHEEAATANYAYSTVTGLRHIPVHREYPGESDLRSGGRTTAPVQMDVKWRSAPPSHRVVRRPGSPVLGRLLWDILDLSINARSLEAGRITVADSTTTSPRLQAHLPALRRATFHDSTELTFWNDYRGYLSHLEQNDSEDFSQRVLFARRHCRTQPYKALVALGLEEKFFDLFLNPEVYHHNLTMYGAADAATVAAALPTLHVLRENTMTTRQPDDTLTSWFARCGEDPDTQRLFVDAFIDHYSHLPLLRKTVLETFLRDGEVRVRPNSPTPVEGITGPRVYRLSHLLNSNPLLFQRFNVLSQPGESRLIMELSVNPLSVLEALRFTELYLHSNADTKDPFNILRSTVFREMVQYTIDKSVVHVRSVLLRAADLAASKLAATELAKYCQTGPYTPTQLVVTGFDPTAIVWENHWEAVEAVACPGNRCLPGRARVCAVYCADGGRSEVVTFAFCDDFGNLAATTKWTRVNLSRPEGIAQHRRQCQELLKLCTTFFPNVIAVAMVNPRSIRLLRTLQSFVKEYVFPELNTYIPVIFASAAVGPVFAYSAQGQRELPEADAPLRAAVAVARFLRDPLLELCRYFNEDRDIMSFPLPLSRGSDSGKMYHFLEREMSLWVSATAFELQTMLSQCHAEYILQFNAGLGLQRSRALVTALQRGGLGSRAPLRQILPPAIAANALPTIRIDDDCRTGSNNDDEDMHPADATLIPPAWYPVADRLVQHLMAIDTALPPDRLDNDAPAPVAWVYVMEMTEDDRWGCACELRYKDAVYGEVIGNASRLVQLAAGENTSLVEEIGPLSVPTRANIDFILDEIIALGNSYLRRPFRLVTPQRLMKELTGVTYCPKSGGSACRLGRELGLEPTDMVLREGDQVECTISGYNTRRFSLRLTTSFGLDAQMGTTLWDFGDDLLRAEALRFLEDLADYSSRMQNRQTDYGGSGEAPVRPEPPEWMSIGHPIYGTVVSCNYAWCELKLCWSPPPTTTDMASAGGLITNYTSGLVAASKRPGSDIETATSALSVNTQMLTEHALAYVTTVSRHPLFRNVSNAEELLMDPAVKIGEAILRRDPHHQYWMVLCIKSGAHRVSNWSVKVDRNELGKFMLEVPDRRLKKARRYESVDHCLSEFVEPMMAKITELRAHRRFCDSVEDADSALLAASLQNDEHKLFTYRFVETAAPNGDVIRVPHAESTLPYAVVFKVNGKRRQLSIHIDEQGYHIRLGSQESEWFTTETAESLGMAVKSYAGELYKSYQRAAQMRISQTAMVK